jgi:hypothetical protein
MAKGKKKKTKKASRLWLALLGGLVLVTGGGLYLFSQSSPAYSSLESIGQGKPAIVQVFLPT